MLMLYRALFAFSGPLIWMGSPRKSLGMRYRSNNAGLRIRANTGLFILEFKGKANLSLRVGMAAEDEEEY